MNVKSRKKLLFLTIELIVFLIVFVAGIEIYLRATQPRIVQQNDENIRAMVVGDSPPMLVDESKEGRFLVPNAKVIILNHNLSKKDIRIDINSIGCRDDEVPMPKLPNEYRVFVMGDSITYADYLQKGEIYIDKAADYLNEKFTNKNVRMINCGIGGIGLPEEMRILKTKGLSLESDLVLVGFYLNDSRPPWGFSGEVGHQGWLLRHSLLAEKFYKGMELRKWIKKTGVEPFAWIDQMNKVDWKNSREQFLDFAKLAKYDWGAAWEENSWETINANFDELKSLAEQHGFKVAVTCFPVKFQVYSTYLEDYPQQQLKKICDSHEFPYLDLLPTFRQHNNEKLFYDICHPTLSANAIVGEKLGEFLSHQFKQELEKMPQEDPAK